MRKTTFGILIIISSISLFGLIFTQLYWVRRAIIISEQQFDHGANMALNEVRDRMEENNVNLTNTMEWELFALIDTALMYKLMLKYFDFYQLHDHFEYAIKESEYDSVVYSTKGYFIKKRDNTTIIKKCLSCLVKDDFYHLEVFFPAKRKHIILQMALWLSFSVIFLIITIAGFVYIIIVYNKQKKLTEIKNDFINNMTHEFKTPLSTISLASEVLLNAELKSPKERIKKYSKIIFDENQRMRLQVDRVLQLAVLDKGDYTLKKAKSDLHSLLRVTIHNLCLERCDKPVSVDFKFEAENSFAIIDIMHIINVITNLVDNAVKYSGENPEILISTQNMDGGIEISIADNGIGMSADVVKHIFEKFYRASTGNIHNVKGSGLGLYYVKKIVDAHKGKIWVDSTLDKGSCFHIFLPLDVEE